MKLTKEILKGIPIGGRITCETLEVRRTAKGLAFYASKQVRSKRLRYKLGTEQGGMNLTKARDALIRLSQSIPEGVDPSIAKPDIRFDEAAALYIGNLQQSGGKNLAQKEQQLRMHLGPFFRREKIKTLKTLDVEKYAHQRRTTGAAVSTVNRELATLKHMMRQLADWDVVVTKHIKVKSKSGEKRREKTFSEEQVRKMLECARLDSDPYTYLFVLFGFLTSMRHGEILRIRFEDFDHYNKCLHVPEAKAGSRNVPVHDSLLQIVLAEKKARGVEKGFLFAADSKTGRRSYMKKQFKRVLVAAGLAESGLTPHSMRHAAISILGRQGMSTADMQQISGHKSQQMLLRYTHHSNTAVARGLDALAGVTGHVEHESMESA